MGVAPAAIGKDSVGADGASARLVSSVPMIEQSGCDRERRGEGMTDEATGEVSLLQGARAFDKEAAPAFLDHAAMLAGFAPPPGSPVGEGQGAGFAWCELHCGRATTAALLAAANPLGDFHGIDARDALVEDGQALAVDGGVRNLTLHRAAPEEALDLSLPAFDYVVVSGVYSWVPMRERALVLAFLRKFLKPGGIAYLTYNARPGWNRLDLFRRLYRDATRGLEAEPHRRLALTRGLYAQLEKAGSPAIRTSGTTAASLADLERIPPEALAADYANDFAEPLYVSEVIADLSAIDCHLAGPAHMAETVPVLIAHEPFRSALGAAANQIAQELVKDVLLDTRLRRDVFVRGGRRISADNREMMMNGLAFALERPAEDIVYSAKLAFGTMSFDTAEAHTIVARLAQEPRTLGDLLGSETERARAAASSLHALLVTEQIRPVYRRTRAAGLSAARLREAIIGRKATPSAIGFLPSGYGTAFHVPVADQALSGLPTDMAVDARAGHAIAQLGGEHLSDHVREMIQSRSRGFERYRRYYGAVGLELDNYK